MKQPSNLPKQGHVYSLREVYSLELGDAPCLMVLIGDHRYPVQDSHVTEEQLLSVPGLADTQWEYKRTTHEWVPVFNMEQYGGTKAETFFDVQRLEAEDSYWITPKGFPRKVPE